MGRHSFSAEGFGTNSALPFPFLDIGHGVCFLRTGGIRGAYFLTSLALFVNVRMEGLGFGESLHSQTRLGTSVRRKKQLLRISFFYRRDTDGGGVIEMWRLDHRHNVDWPNGGRRCPDHRDLHNRAETINEDKLNGSIDFECP